mmetsp:Transcript_1527/g.3436  ORF Transcript_1527/g.3436 Transcript_1527/m.3436 type:complete len:293 (+) Transcript_1527:630-1508(+)
MFFFRSMIFKTPSFVISPMSPVWNHPSGSRDAQFTSATSAAQVTTWPVTGMGHADRIKTQVVAPADTETAATQGRFLRAPWHPREPPRRTEDLLGHLLALVVPREDGVAPDADLSARGVRKGVVVHVGNRLEADLHPGQRQPHVRPDPPGDRHAAPGHRLCQAVTLDDVAHHADLEELLHVRAERRSPGADQPDAAAERLLDLGEDELVEERRGLPSGEESATPPAEAHPARYGRKWFPLAPQERDAGVGAPAATFSWGRPWRMNSSLRWKAKLKRVLFSHPAAFILARTPL